MVRCSGLGAWRALFFIFFGGHPQVSSMRVTRSHGKTALLELGQSLQR
jgi:hypothetical protein